MSDRVDLGPLLPLVPAETHPPDTRAVVMPDGALDHAALAAHVARTTALLDALPGDRTGSRPLVAVPAVPRLATVVAVLAALRSGTPVVPISTTAGPAEVAHVLADAAPATVVAPRGHELPGGLTELDRLEVDLSLPAGGSPLDHTDARPHDLEGQRGGDRTAHPRERSTGGVARPIEPATPALVIYTSGTTGPPKGVVLSHGALAADLDALATAWRLGPDDVLVHALPLSHVHGLVLGVLGPLRAGATVHHLGRFAVDDVGRAFHAGATVMYGVPTMYHRLADAMAGDPALAGAVGSARLLVSGSAGLPAHDRDRIEAATGLTVLERYGMTETLITCAMTVDGAGEPGTVGPPLPGVELRIVDDAGGEVAPDDPDTVGEIHVRSATLYSGYLHRPEATAASTTPDGWFRTGDLATWSPSGAVRISGRSSLDLIKSGGYRIGAGEVENALLSHPSVAEVAVTGEPDPDLGERLVAWVVPVTGSSPDPVDLADHVGTLLAAHKRPREVRMVTGLPRNELGKVLKRDLAEAPSTIGGVSSPPGAS